MLSTPHINPQGVPIAETVLLPGDPLRAKFIAENYLDDVVQFNKVRNMLGYTGTFHGSPVSVMGSGMGIPSISLISHELLHIFGARRLIRVGSCGSFQAQLKPYNIIVAQGACTDSRFIEQFQTPGTYAPICSWNLLKAISAEAERQGIEIHVGNILSSDIFYHFDNSVNERWARMGVLGVEMESAGMYAVAAAAGAEALGVFTVSDNLITGEKTTSEEREKAFTQMMELALPLATLG
ncbi:purine-nucleoside phosphorylase [Corynebacterium poyangense]|uniref:Uridine phosphorylase n=1 Tax=Corynebacterium poyangense TaxID=2684405 RepID=A0A7H0SPK5_9CORY|nr:purine-nucleoside phosphorylase [Corynebacterium poyangense]QNQ90480.1 purine-nucleoside phosphorylase [Corynebacterium poyangense]